MSIFIKRGGAGDFAPAPPAKRKKGRTVKNSLKACIALSCLAVLGTANGRTGPVLTVEDFCKMKGSEWSSRCTTWRMKKVQSEEETKKRGAETTPIGSEGGSLADDVQQVIEKLTKKSNDSEKKASDTEQNLRDVINKIVDFRKSYLAVEGALDDYTKIKETAKTKDKKYLDAVGQLKTTWEGYQKELVALNKRIKIAADFVKITLPDSQPFPADLHLELTVESLLRFEEYEPHVK